MGLFPHPLWSFIITVLLYLSLFATTTLANMNTKYDRLWKRRKTDCENKICNHLLPFEDMNCVNECISATCYREVYSSEPLEDGEIDIRRSKLFSMCIRKEARQHEVSLSSMGKPPLYEYS
jgi:hypothetical protein